MAVFDPDDDPWKQQQQQAQPQAPQPQAPQPRPTMPPSQERFSQASSQDQPEPFQPPAPAPAPQQPQQAQQPQAPAGGVTPQQIRSQSAGKSEDFDRFDDAQIQAWMPFYDAAASAQAGRPQFRSERGASGFFDKPTECPEGQGPAGPDRDGRPAPCTTKGYSEPGAPGGGGGGGGGGYGGPGGAPGMDEASGEIWKSIMGRLQGGGTRFTPQVMDQLLGSLKSQAEGAAGRASAEAEESMARRGMSRSSLAGTAQRQIRTGLAGDMMKAQSELARAKIDADFADKTQAINDGMNWLNSLRSYVTASNATAAQREASMANIQLGYKQLRHQTDTMREQYQQNLSLMTFQQ